MTPKEKAEELISKYQSKKIIEYTPYAGGNTEYTALNDREAKECALICVDEILFALNTTECNTTLLGIMRNDYWQEVKKEIENI